MTEVDESREPAEVEPNGGASKPDPAAVPVGDIEAAARAGAEALRDEWVLDTSTQAIPEAQVIVGAVAPKIAGPAFERGREAGLQEARELIEARLQRLPDGFRDEIFVDRLAGPFNDGIRAALAALGSGEPDGREADGAAPSASPAVTKDGGEA